MSLNDIGNSQNCQTIDLYINSSTKMTMNVDD